MRIYTIEKSGCRRVAVEKDGKLHVLRDFPTMNAFIEHCAEAAHASVLECDEETHARAADGHACDKLAHAAGDPRGDKVLAFADEVLDFDDVKICSPIPEPRQDVICLGVNYGAHASEAKKGIDMDKDEATIYFSKRVSHSPGTGDSIPLYDFVDSTDYEVELGVIIGRKARNVKREDALSHVFGYTVINDVSARNLQKKHKQFYFAKSLDGYTPMGPCIVTADEIEEPGFLAIKCYVNGELRQDSCTADMIMDVPGIIEELSQGVTLLPGTIIATGTPAGVAMAMDPPVFLKDGDVVECEIEKIGKLTNVFEDWEKIS